MLLLQLYYVEVMPSIFSLLSVVALTLMDFTFVVCYYNGPLLVQCSMMLPSRYTFVSVYIENGVSDIYCSNLL